MNMSEKAMRGGKWVVLGSLPLLALLFLLSFLFDLQLQPALARLGLNNTISISTTAPPPPPDLSIFIGILSLPDSYERRHLLRLVYDMQSYPNTHIDIKFVFCNLTKPEQHLFISLEIRRFDDIIILNCTENMDKGKTYTYFSSLPSILPRRYDYVMKADDDTYLSLDHLASSLRRQPREDLYYGFVVPCGSKDPFVVYMSGMGYVLSWDLVEWISESDIPANNTEGPEDKLVGEWLTAGEKAKNRFTDKPAMYNFPGTDGDPECAHELIPGTVAVHRLKRWDKWRDVLRFFNVTKGLKPSKLYNIDLNL